MKIIESIDLALESIDLAQYCLDRITLLNHRISNRREILASRIKRNEQYENLRELKAEIDSMNDELLRVTALYDYYDEKIFKL